MSTPSSSMPSKRASTSGTSRFLRTAAGAVGKYGFYEAVDYTKIRTEGKGPQVIKTYMAHHMGMRVGAVSCITNMAVLQIETSSLLSFS